MGTALTYESRRLPRADEPLYASRRQNLLRREPYTAAIPARIADIALDLSPDTLAEADDASAALVRFDSETTHFPAPFSAVLLRSESASSSQIEQLTSGTRAIAEAVIGERADGNAPLIVSNVRAMEAAIALADDISDASIIAMQKALLGDSAPDAVGRYRAEQVWVGGRLPHDASFVPPHHDRVPEAMADLVAFARRTDLPVLVQAAVAHAQFETIHPFPDGNGRTGRALLHAMLRHGGILRHLAVPVSAGLLSDIDGYFDALTAYRRGEADAIVQVFSSASLQAVDNARRLAAAMAALQAGWDSRLTGIRADAAARSIATATLEYPVINLATAMRATGASKPAVTNGLAQLVERGVLAPGNSKRRKRVWVNQEVLDALDAFVARAGRRNYAD
ncbi:Fic family protein [Leifsonia sp. F6_8S_P_1B]|uniref:Fic family protein n=1 Tax=Leifsonia williamsii TaxID=3035919 RepID=A0ABT8K8K1_9MICO|nr:Fic family protein [Leifsonia williamsii]MDN4613775.1 Fic family protein [Leifsonia williamsii]